MNKHVDGHRIRPQLNIMMLRLADFSSSLRDSARASALLTFVDSEKLDPLSMLSSRLPATHTTSQIDCEIRHSCLLLLKLRDPWQEDTKLHACWQI